MPWTPSLSAAQTLTIGPAEESPPEAGTCGRVSFLQPVSLSGMQSLTDTSSLAERHQAALGVPRAQSLAEAKEKRNSSRTERPRDSFAGILDLGGKTESGGVGST